MKINRMSSNHLMMVQILKVGLLAFLIIAVFTPLDHSFAAGWQPTENVEIIVGTAAGSGSDTLARTIALLMKKNGLVNTNIIVVNKPGAGGRIASEYLNQHAGNGHLLMPTTLTLLTSHIDGKSPFTYTHFTPLASLSNVPCVFTVRADSPIKTGKDLIDRLKKDSKSLSIGFASMRGNFNHAAIALVLKSVGGDFLNLKIAIFDSSAKTEIAVLGGHVDLAISPPRNVLAQKEAGKLRPIAIADTKRLGGAFADVPTWREQGIDAVMGSTRSIVGPKGMSQEQIAYWEDVFKKFAHLDEWKKYLENIFEEGIYFNSKESEKYLATTYEQFKDILTALGMAK